MITAILLAAGKSERMGRLKQLIEFRGKTFVRHSVDNLLNSAVDEVIVVTGYQSDAVLEALLANRGLSQGYEDPSIRLRFVHNPDYEVGMSSSIKTAMAAIKPDCEAVLIALADQPLVNPHIVNQLVSEYYKVRPLVLVPTYHGKRGHPVLIRTTLTDEILAMDDNVGLGQVIRSHSAGTCYLPIESPSILVDFDYPSDLEKLPQ